MEYVTLGKTGLRVSRMGLGGIPIQKIDAEGTKTLLHKLADRGVNYIDTARGYTVSEEYLGYALEGIRDRFIIATKSMARTKEAMAEDIEKSLHNLRTDHVGRLAISAKIVERKRMKVIDLIHSNKKTAFSFEILPPLKGTGIEKLYQTIDTLREFDPKYINITTHRSEYVYKDLGNGLFQRNRLRRRPGTVAVAAAIQNKYNITVVPHILCSGFTREETEYVLLDLDSGDNTDRY